MENQNLREIETIENVYVGIFERVKAVVIDSIVFVFLLVAVTQLFSMFDNVPDTARMIAFVFIFILYDPLFTSFLGGTPGHHINGIRVKLESNQTRNIILPLAILRFIIKVSLGWLSLLTVSGNSQRKAIHDMVAGSVVIYKPEGK